MAASEYLLEQDALPVEGHPSAVHGYGHRALGLLDHGAGEDRRDPLVAAGRSARDLRGSRGHHQIQVAEKGGAAQARGDRGEPAAARGHHQGSEAADRFAPAAGRQGAALSDAARRICKMLETHAAKRQFDSLEEQRAAAGAEHRARFPTNRLEASRRSSGRNREVAVQRAALEEMEQRLNSARQAVNDLQHAHLESRKPHRFQRRARRGIPRAHRALSRGCRRRGGEIPHRRNAAPRHRRRARRRSPRCSPASCGVMEEKQAANRRADRPAAGSRAHHRGGGQRYRADRKPHERHCAGKSPSVDAAARSTPRRG